MLTLLVSAVLFAAYALVFHSVQPSSAIVRCALPAAMLPIVLGRAPLATRPGSTSSLLSRVFGSHAPLMDAPFLMLPRVVEDEFANALDMLNRAVGGMVHVETDEKTQDLKISFDDMGLFDKVDVSYDQTTGLLTVHALETGGRAEGGGETTEATRVITMPCGVSKPELVTAEAIDGRVVVTVPKEAQAPVAEKKVVNQKLEVRLLTGGKEQSKPLAPGGPTSSE